MRRASSRTLLHRPQTSRSIRGGLIMVLSAALIVAACGTGGDANQVADTAPTTSETAVTPVRDTTVALGTEPVDAVIDDSDPARRVLPLALRAESDVASNALPSVELHDVGRDRMVNFRNIFPAERPVLLWMWAPY